MTIDPVATDLSGADLAACTGWIDLEGTLTLDHVPVRCIADIALAIRSGRGRLQV